MDTSQDQSNQQTLLAVCRQNSRQKSELVSLYAHERVWVGLVLACLLACALSDTDLLANCGRPAWIDGGKSLTVVARPRAKIMENQPRAPYRRPRHISTSTWASDWSDLKPWTELEPKQLPTSRTQALISSPPGKQTKTSNIGRAYLKRCDDNVKGWSFVIRLKIKVWSFWSYYHLRRPSRPFFSLRPNWDKMGLILRVPLPPLKPMISFLYHNIWTRHLLAKD